MPRPSTWLLSDLWLDLRIILQRYNRPQNLRNIVWVLFASDGFAILTLFRLRKWCRRHHIPLVSRILRMVETALFAVEIGNDVELGRGVFFMHSVGTVIGGTSHLGDGCILLGSNTIGQNKLPGYPRIGARTVIGAGARVLGVIRVGDDCVIGANAVVLADVPDGKVAVGIPARVVGDNKDPLPPFEMEPVGVVQT
jgi:serine O-acetyltransferase